MSRDPNLPAIPPDPPTPDPTHVPTRSNVITCQYCENELTPSGDVFRGLSARAKKLNRLEETNEELRRQVADLEGSNSELLARLETANAEIAALKKPAPEPDKKPGFWRR